MLERQFDNTVAANYLPCLVIVLLNRDDFSPAVLRDTSSSMISDTMSISSQSL
jgi:hypothetical protein